MEAVDLSDKNWRVIMLINYRLPGYTSSDIEQKGSAVRKLEAAVLRQQQPYQLRAPRLPPSFCDNI